MPIVPGQWGRSMGLICLGVLIMLATVIYIRQGQESVRREIMEVDKGRRESERAATERETRALLLLEVLKQAQAIGISEQYTDRRFDELRYTFTRQGERTTQPTTKP